MIINSSDLNFSNKLRSGELNVIFNVENHQIFKNLKNEECDFILFKIRDLVWSLDELFANSYLISYDENFKNYCKEKSIKENISYIEVLKMEVTNYRINPDIINENKIVMEVVNFICPRIKKILDDMLNCERASMESVFLERCSYIFLEAQDKKQKEINRSLGIF